jgi:hypothetical protein
MAYLVDESVDILFVSETWMFAMNNDITASIKSYGFNIIHQIRSCSATGKSRGGGTGIIFKKSLNLTRIFTAHGKSFESVCAKLKSKKGDNIFLCTIYRPPNIPAEEFLTELDDFLANVFLKFSKIIICGDVNLHLEKPKQKNTIKFTEVISSYGLTQLIEEPTHQAGHCLDVIISSHNITEMNSVIVEKLDASAFPKCDHYPCSFNFSSNIVSQTNEKKCITFRNLRLINNDEFRHDLQQSLSSTNTSSEATFEEAISTYDSLCLKTIDAHAPMITKTITDRKSAPWFDGEYKCQRILRRKAEARWKKSHSPADKATYIKLRNHCSDLALKKKQLYHQQQFEKHNHSPKSLFNFVDTFMDKDKELILPPSESLADTVENFNQYFEEKIDKIRSRFSDNNHHDQTDPESIFKGQCLSEFAPATIDEIKNILSDTEFKSSSTDPLPASIMKENIDVILPALCDLVNASLKSGSMEGVKTAHITPLIKGLGLDHAEFKNYRPISNLSFVGKLIERVVLSRLNNHLETNNLNMPLQSGYKKCHSTETLLIRIVNDLLIATCERKATIVMLLDLSAAFDTVDHQMLLKILEKEIGLTGSALDWFKSFLTGRCQRVRIGTHESIEIIIRFGVPQGSVLGPVLFNIYIRSLYRTVLNLKFNIHGYADDHQIYKDFFSTDEYNMLVDEIPECFNEIRLWMDRHYLQLNAGKTEFIVFGSPAMLNQLSINGVFLDSDVCIRFSPVVKNLGFRLDKTLSMRQQTSILKSSCFIKMRNIGKMRRFLSTKQLQILVQAVITSSLDYCNALYYDCNQTVIDQLQLIQNKACRTIFGLKKRDSVQAKLKQLHWLKIEQRIEFKILLLVYKSLNGLAPVYLCELFIDHLAGSGRTSNLLMPKQHLQCTRALQIAGPKLWNSLPNIIRNSSSVDIFKQQLKTHLFKNSYGLD